MVKLSSNTHDYDTFLKDSYIEFKKNDENELIQPIDFDKTINEIYTYIRRLEFNIFNKKAIDALLLMKNDTINNYDKKNNIYIEDLLPRVWRFVKNYDASGITIFIEQLAEIVTAGPCAQGRTTRLFQFYSHHMDTKDELYNKYKRILI